MSSTTAKVIAACVGIALAVGIGVVFSKHRAIAPAEQEMATTTDDVAPTTSTTSSPSAAAPRTGTKSVSASQSSSASVEQDLSAVDAQINAVAADGSDADKGMNDTPIEQSY